MSEIPNESFLGMMLMIFHTWPELYSTPYCSSSQPREQKPPSPSSFSQFEKVQLPYWVPMSGASSF